MHFTIVTPCYNAEHYIEATIESIFSQKALHTGRATLEYIVADGYSTDGTLGIVEQYAKRFSHGTVHIFSEHDRGMYDALAKGLKRATGEVCAYLNAGDLYSPHAFDVIIDALQTHALKWFTSLQTIYNEKGQVVSCHIPFPYRSRLFQCGLYNNITLPYLQQESTFWHADLHQFVDFERLAEFKYAGDYYLWHCFSQQTELKIIETQLGGFRIHKGQLSENNAAYNAELHSIARQPGLLDKAIAFYDKVSSYMPRKLWQRSLLEKLIIYNHHTQQWVTAH